jgi:hypothetical protein
MPKKKAKAIPVPVAFEQLVQRERVAPRRKQRNGIDFIPMSPAGDKPPLGQEIRQALNKAEQSMEQAQAKAASGGNRARNSFGSQPAQRRRSVRASEQRRTPSVSRRRRAGGAGGINYL